MFDFVRIGAASLKLRVGDVFFNADEIVKAMQTASERGVSLLALPELCLTGYTCADMFAQDPLIAAAETTLGDILVRTADLDICAAVGMPVRAESQLFNCAVVIHMGKILGVVPKTYLPNYTEFYDERYFSPAARLRGNAQILCGQCVPFGTDILFANVGQNGFTFGVEICEDLWSVIPPSSLAVLAGAEIILNLSASNEIVYKDDYRRELVSGQSGRTIAVYAYANAGYGESSTDIVFSGHSVIAENGSVLVESGKFKFDTDMIIADADIGRIRAERRRISTFSKYPDSIRNAIPEYRTTDFTQGDSLYTLERTINPHPFIPSPGERDRRCENIFSIQVSGLARRLEHTNCKSAVIGISGGLDSTLALLCTVRAYDLLKRDRSGIIAVTMPGFGTTDRTYHNAVSLMKTLGVSIREIPIAEAATLHFRDIGHDASVHDVTYENVQARERTQILMDIANQSGGIVIGTGDLSEIALGWSTYNGDHMSMYAVNCGIPKTLVRVLVGYVADTFAEARAVLADIIDTPVSPELLPASHDGKIAQKTEEIVGPYELHDFFLYYMVRFGFSPAKIAYLAKCAFGDKYKRAEIKKWLILFYKRFFSQQFKRSCIPDGPKVGSVGLSPRGDLKMPSDIAVAVWLKEAEAIEE
ncbi:NAD(+) synthase [Clostridia bacterium]|nr:NAD(+) synthase [Clostridia bacterium]